MSGVFLALFTPFLGLFFLVVNFLRRTNFSAVIFHAFLKFRKCSAHPKEKTRSKRSFSRTFLQNDIFRFRSPFYYAHIIHRIVIFYIDCILRKRH